MKCISEAAANPNCDFKPSEEDFKNIPEDKLFCRIFAEMRHCACTEKLEVRAAELLKNLSMRYTNPSIDTCWESAKRLSSNGTNLRIKFFQTKK
ncbi:unnamed protein product, partial [Larinioides sclopetarius]